MATLDSLAARMYSLSKFISVAPAEDMRLALFVLDRGTKIRLEFWVYEVLLRLADMRTFTPLDFQMAVQSEKPLPDTECTQLLEQLCELGVLWTEGALKEWERCNAPAELSWEEFGWVAAKQFHEAVVYSTFLQGDPEGWQEQLRSMESLTAHSEGPPPVRCLPAELPAISLDQPAGVPTSDFFTTLMNRRTVRRFTSGRSISKATLSTVLYYAAKAHWQYQSRFFGPEVRRTSPSGGSRHPVELYPQIFDSNEDLAGNYYYDHVAHKLIRMGDVTKEFLTEVSQKQLRLEKNFIVFLVTARFARNYWKYRYPKSYSFTLFDVGHFVQTLILVCEALGLKCFLTPALDVRKVQRHLLLPNIYDECPVYFVAAGYPDD